MLNATLFALWFVLGAILGSFTNVLILRDDKKGIMTGRSHCPKCKHVLGPLDLVPMLSFLFLRGKCRYCRKPISVQYPVVEALMGLLGMLALWYGVGVQESWLTAINLLISFVFFGAIVGIDFRTMEVAPEYCVLAGIFGFFAATVAEIGNLPDQLLGIVVGAGSIAFVMYAWKLLYKRDGMGEGDIYIAGAVGATAGYPNIVVALFAAVFIGAVAGIAIGMRSPKRWQTAVPFGPFLFLGLLIALAWGQRIVDWYII